MAVALVGAGPGDPDLLTLRGEALLGAAAAVVTDSSVRGLAQQFAWQAAVTVVPDGEAAVGALLAATQAGPVVRLYAGDPWLHPSHMTELAALQASGMASEGVAGVAVEVAVAARAGIAVHVRHLARVCTFGPLNSVPSAPDSSHTFVVRVTDGAAAAQMLARAGSSRARAALVSIATPHQVERGTVAEIGRIQGPLAASILVLGSVTTIGSSSGPQQ